MAPLRILHGDPGGSPLKEGVRSSSISPLWKRGRSLAENEGAISRVALEALLAAATLPGNDPSFQKPPSFLQTLQKQIVEEKIPLGQALSQLPSEEVEWIRSKVGKENLEAFVSLSRERDPEIFSASLLNWGQRWMLAGQEERALGVFQVLQKEEINSSVRLKAKQEWDAIAGQGSSGRRFEYLFKNFTHHASDYQTIAPMLVGSAIYQMARAATLGHLAILPRATWLTRGFGAKLAASLVGTAAELPVFALGGRFLHQFAGDPVRKNVWSDLASAGITLGLLKLSGWVGKIVGARFTLPACRQVGPVGAMNRAPTWLSQSSAFLGLLGAHQLEEHWNLRPRADDATTATDILASMVSLGIGANLGSRILGPGFAAFQRDMEFRAENLPKEDLGATRRELLASARGPGQIRLLQKGPRSHAAANPLPTPWSLMSTDSVGGKVQTPPPSMEGITLPEFQPHLEVAPELLERIDSLPETILRLHAKDEPNQVFYALNHTEWWIGLIRADIGEIGAQALVDGGQILYGRWQEEPKRQKEVEALLKDITKEADRNGWWHFQWDPPSTESWWGPWWKNLLKKTDSQSQLFSETLRRVRIEEDPELFQRWFQELADRDIDKSIEVQQWLERYEPLAVPSLDPEFLKGAKSLDGIFENQSPLAFNKKAQELYLEALSNPDPFKAFHHLWYLRENLSHPRLQPVRPLSLPGEESANEPIGEWLSSAPSSGISIYYDFFRPLFDDLWSQNLDQFDRWAVAAAWVYFDTRFGQKTAYNTAQIDELHERVLSLTLLQDIRVCAEVEKLMEGNWKLNAESLPDIKKIEKIFEQEGIHGTTNYLKAERSPACVALMLAHLANVVTEKAASVLEEPTFQGIPPGAVLLQVGKTYQLGRSPQNDIVIPDNAVSSNHLEFRVALEGNQKTIYLKDKGSANGTILHRHKIPPESEFTLSYSLHEIAVGPVPISIQLEQPLKASDRIAIFYDRASRKWVLKSFKDTPQRLEFSKRRISAQEFIDAVQRLSKHIFEIALYKHEKSPTSQDAYWSILAVTWCANVRRLLGEEKQAQALIEFSESLIQAVNSKLGMDSAATVEEVKKWLRLDLERIQALPFEYMPPEERLRIETWVQEGKLLEAIQDIQDRPALPHQKMEALAYLLHLFMAVEAKKKTAQPMAPEPIDHFSRLQKRSIETIPEEYRYLIPKPKDIVLDEHSKTVLNETASLMMAPDRIAIRAFGPPGTGKTIFTEIIAERMGVPLLRVPFSKRTDPDDLEGLWEMAEVEGKLIPVYKEGAPTVAMEHGFHLVLDEPDLARPGVLAYLNNVSAPGEYAWVRKLNGQLVKIQVHEGYRVTATENGVREVGREEHGEDFLRRFAPRFIGPWSKEVITRRLAEIYENQGGKRRWDRKTSETLAIFHKFMEQLAKGFVDPETRQAMPPLGGGSQQIQFTPRSILRVAQRLVAAGHLSPESLSRAIRAEYILPLAFPEDRERVWTQAAAIFRKPVAERLGWPKNAIGPHAIPEPTLESISKNYLGGRKIPKGSFVWTKQAIRLTDEILWNKSLGIDVMLLGGAGGGKTKLPPQIARLLGLPYYLTTISSGTDEEDLVGGVGRTNGKIEFIPGVVTRVTQNGGVGHLDEYLLGDTGKLESVMNPLMDSTRALILKNPYRPIPRHPDAFFLLSSNPPFGNFGDRHEHSGAAMSRVAVIFLSEEFAIQSEDRKMMTGEWFKKPLGRKKSGGGIREIIEPGPKREMALPRSETPMAFAPFLRHSTPNQAQKVTKEVKPLKIHPEVREFVKKKWNLDLPIRIEMESDKENAKILEVREDGSKVPYDPKKRIPDFLKFADYLQRRTQIEMVPLTRKVFQILYSFEGNHTTDLASKRIILNLSHLLGIRVLGALFAGKHEWAHALIDRHSPKYDAFEAGRLYANVVGDPRMNNFVASLRPDFAEQMEAFYETMWEESWSEEEIKLFLTKSLPHEQFADNIIYYWKHQKIMPWLTDQRVVTALEKALPILEPAFTLFPKSHEEEDIEAAAEQFYAILDEAYPYYQELFHEALKELAERIERGEDPEQFRQPPILLILRIPFNPPEPPSPQPSPTRGEGGEKGVSKVPSPPAGEGQGEGGAAERDELSDAPTLPREPKGDKTQIGLGPRPEEDTIREKRKDPDAEDTLVDPTPSDPSKTKKPNPQRIAEELLEARAEALADRFEPRDPEAFKRRKEAIEKAQGKLQTEEKGHKESEGPIPSELQAQEDPTAEKPLSESEIREIQAEAQRVVQEQVQSDLFLRYVPMSAIQAAQRLKRLIPPSNPTYSDDHFTSGKKLDQNRAVQDAMSPMPTGKVMLRRLGVEGVDARLVKITDITISMVLARAEENVLKSSAAATFLSETLKVDYGEILLGERARIAKPLGRPLNTYRKKNELLNTIQQGFQDSTLNGATNIREPLALAIEMLKKKKTRHSYILLITDGGENIRDYPKSLEELQEEAEKEGIHLMVLAMGQAQDSVPRIFKHYKFVAANGSDIPEKTIELFEEAHRNRLKSGGGG